MHSQLTTDSNPMQCPERLFPSHAPTHHSLSGARSVFRNQPISDSGHTLATPFAVIKAKGSGP